MNKYDSLERRRIRQHPEDWPAILTDGTRRCTLCTRRVQAAPEGADLPLIAHYDEGWRRWCPAGPPPTDKDKARRKRQRVVTSIVRGGAPGSKR